MHGCPAPPNSLNMTFESDGSFNFPSRYFRPIVISFDATFTLDLAPVIFLVPSALLCSACCWLLGFCLPQNHDAIIDIHLPIYRQFVMKALLLWLFCLSNALAVMTSTKKCGNSNKGRGRNLELGSVFGSDQATQTNNYHDLFAVIKLIYSEEHSQHGWITPSKGYSFSCCMLRFRFFASNELHLKALKDKEDTNNHGRYTSGKFIARVPLWGFCFKNYDIRADLRFDQTSASSTSSIWQGFTCSYMMT